MTIAWISVVGWCLSVWLAVSSYNLCLSLSPPVCLVVLLPCSSLITGSHRPWCKQSAGPDRVTCAARPRLWSRDPGRAGHWERGLRHGGRVWASCVCGAWQLWQLACDTDWPAAAAAAAWARLQPRTAWAGRPCCRPVPGAGPGCCELRAGLRILTSTLGPSLGQAVVTSSHGVRTEKRISEQVFIH